MVKHPQNFFLGSMVGLCILAALQACADSTSTRSTTRSTSAQTSASTEQKKIWITVKEGTSPSAVRNFVEYLGCTIEEVIPPGGQLYVLQTPLGTKPETLLPKLTAHPWIVRASLKPDSHD
jgi:hypothetical protein